MAKENKKNANVTPVNAKKPGNNSGGNSNEANINNNTNNKNNTKGSKKMTINELKAYINFVGKNNIAKLCFDNSRSVCFTKDGEFEERVQLIDDYGGIIRIKTEEYITCLEDYHDECVDSLQMIIVTKRPEDKKSVPWE
jgi:hypothetical protein